MSAADQYAMGAVFFAWIVFVLSVYAIGHIAYQRDMSR